MNTNRFVLDQETVAGQSVAHRVDVDHLLEGVGDDTELATELIDMFQEDLPSMLENLKTAIAEEDLEVVNRLAHSLKTPMGLFGATDARDQSHKLELAAVESEATSTSVLVEMFGQLSTELTEVSRELQGVHFAKP
jgi:HPt (histidine-containing phosphotransfer) domain-containing protein